MGAEQIFARAGRIAVPVAETLAEDALNLVSMVRKEGLIEAAIKSERLVAPTANADSWFSTALAMIKSEKIAGALRAVSIDLPEVSAKNSTVYLRQGALDSMTGYRTHFAMEHPIPVKGLEEFGFVKNLRKENQIQLTDDLKQVIGYKNIVTATNPEGLGSLGIVRKYNLKVASNLSSLPVLMSKTEKHVLPFSVENSESSMTLLFGKARGSIDVLSPVKGLVGGVEDGPTMMRTAQVRKLIDTGSNLELSNPSGLFSWEQRMTNGAEFPFNITNIEIEKKSGAILSARTPSGIEKRFWQFFRENQLPLNPAEAIYPMK